MPDDVQPSPPVKPPPSFGGLAKKIRGRTSDLLAIAIVVIGGFAVGSQVSRWWDKPDDAAPETSKNAAGFGEHEPVTLDFGNSPYSMIRSVATGDRKSATQQLVDDCREAAATAPVPSHPPSAAETKLLSRVKTEKPLFTGDGWRLFRVDGPLTMVSVVRDSPGGRGRSGRRERNPGERSNRAGRGFLRSAPSSPGHPSPDATPAPRVVCWGLAFPAGEKRWVLYRFVSASGESPAEVIVRVPLPASATPLLTVRGRTNLWRTFRSGDAIDKVRAWYVGWFREHGWMQATSSGNWTAAFTKDGLRADVQISPQQTGGCAGVVVVTTLKSQ